MNVFEQMKKGYCMDKCGVYMVQDGFYFICFAYILWILLELVILSLYLCIQCLWLSEISLLMHIYI